MSGLASLTAQYTDSENEESPNSNRAPDALNRDMRRVLNAPPVKQLRMKNLHNKVEITPNGSTGPLVAYEGHDSDGDRNESESEDEELQIQIQPSENEIDAIKPVDMDVDSQSSQENSSSNVHIVRPGSPDSYHRELLERGPPVQLPPEPLGKCSEELQTRIGDFCERTQRGLDLLASIQKKKTFRNPSIYEKLLVHCDIDELGSNFPSKIFDPHAFEKDCYYEELSKKQVEAMSKHEKKKTEATGSSGIPAKKSKWDQGAAGVSAGPVVGRGVTAPGLVTVPTGTKSVVISGIGSLPKPKNPVTHVGTSVASRR